jgi:hypothetical protein
MRLRSASLGLLLLAGSACAGIASASDDAGSDDRLAFMANGSWLSEDRGGGGTSLGWLHNFSAATLTDVEAEYEQLSNAHWTFGTLSGTTGFGAPGQKTTLYVEAHEGAGDIGVHPFDYSVVAAGGVQSIGSHFSVLGEDRQFDIGTAHGNLPKLGAAVAWNPQLLTTVAYAYSVSGNLGTKLATVRIDEYGARVSWLVGGAFGPTSPAVLNLETGLVQPGKRLGEGYLGLSTPLSHGKLTLVADYQDVAGFRRFMLTLNYLLDLKPSQPAGGPPK